MSWCGQRHGHCPHRRAGLFSRNEKFTFDRNDPPASREDVTAIATMAAEFNAYLAPLGKSDQTFDIADSAAKLERFGFGAKPLFSALIAELDGQSIGYAIYNKGFSADAFEGMVFVSDLFVREAWRSEGIGKEIMECLTEIGQNEGCGRIMWSVWSKNEKAQWFYESLGAVPAEEEILMEWSIQVARGKPKAQ